MALKTEPCVNCCLHTRADQKMCLHYDPAYGYHPWATKVTTLSKDRAPTAEDREAYVIWLGQQRMGVIQ